MAKVANRSHLKQFSFMLIMIIELSLFLHSVSSQEIPSRKILKQDNSNAVRLDTSNPDTVIVDNGLVRVTFENPSGYLVGIKHGNLDNVLETRNKHSNRGYWDLVWGDNSTYDKMETEHFNVITQTDDLVEISFNKTWNSHDHSAAPLNIDKRFIVRRGVPGIYAYAILEREQNFPSAEMYQIRLAFKLLGDK
ncbi:Rhamnogalacturonate lyase [Corchorus capsularis]|uniref:Rhamnogalacturonate lyase n=1 Tax=Corchorus capsularis TaxID=210143 RepID=A0A1R3GE26_COCAP|nr:Rhamnogalacturonate lyase [Corchorus capsularis]